MTDYKKAYEALVSVVIGYQNMPGFKLHPMVKAQIEGLKNDGK